MKKLLSVKLLSVKLLAIAFVLLFLTGQAFAWDPTGQMWVKTIVAAGDTNDDGSWNSLTNAARDQTTTVFNTAVQTYSGEGNRQDAYPCRLTIYVITSAVSSSASVNVTLQDSPDNTNWATLKALTAITAAGTVSYRTGAQSTDIPESFGKYLRVSFTPMTLKTNRASFTVIGVFRAG